MVVLVNNWFEVVTVVLGRLFGWVKNRMQVPSQLRNLMFNISSHN